MKYITHFCYNKKCNNAWIDEDLYNNRSPVRWKYCPECVLNGFEQRDRVPNPKKRTDKVLENLKKGREHK